MSSCAGQPAHLAFEIGLELVVVEEHDVGAVAHRPERREVMQRRGETARRRLRSAESGSSTHCQKRSISDSGRSRDPVGEELGEIVEPDRGGAGADQRVEVHVVTVVVPRERDVAGVAADGDVGDARRRRAARRAGCAS